jgi:hypothetical protein
MCDFVHPDRLPVVKALVQEQRKAEQIARRVRKLKQREIKSEARRVQQLPKLLCRFLKLPREIRDLVYDIAWTGTVLPFFQELEMAPQQSDHPFGLLLVAEYSSSGRYSAHIASSLEIFALRNGLPSSTVPKYAWIWICRQMFLEATDQFYRHTQVTDIVLSDWAADKAALIQKRKLRDGPYAFPNMFLTRRVSINIEPAWGDHRVNEFLGLLLDLLSKTKSVGVKKVLLIKMRKRSTSLALGNFSIEMMPEEGSGFEALRQKGWSITIKR